MNYETQLKHFVEEYATATFSNKNIICSIETDDETVSLISTEGNKSKAILTYEYSKNHGVDEMSGIENRKYFFEDYPSKFIKCEDGFERLRRIFTRYCNVFSVNYILADISYLVKNESSPQKEIAVSHIGLSNEYRRITLNESAMEIAVEIYLKDGSLFSQMVIESIEE